jgi:hypothetical protein
VSNVGWAALTLKAATERSVMKWRRLIGFDYRSDVATPNENKISCGYWRRNQSAVEVSKSSKPSLDAEQ